MIFDEEATGQQMLDEQCKPLGIPNGIVTTLKEMKIKKLFDWQENCLKIPGVLDGTKNLVYTAPTGGGKSLGASCGSRIPVWFFVV